MSDANNNNGKPPGKQELQRPIKPSRALAIEKGIRAHFEAEEEIEHLKGTIDQQRMDLQAHEMEIRGLKERLDTQRDDHARQMVVRESREHELQAQRDLAVSEAAALKTILASVRKIVGLVDGAEVRPAAAERHDDEL